MVFGVGLLIFGTALAALLVSGRTEIRTSADAESPPTALVTVLLPIVVAMVLIRLVPPRLPALPPLTQPDRPALVRQGWALTVIAVVFALLVLVVDLGDWYGLVKVALLLGGSWLALRIWRAPSTGAAAQRAAMPRWAYWLGPVPAILAWGYLLYYSPLAGDRDMSGYEQYDTGILVAAMVITFLTASVAEEIFYRVLLQTRLEALLGRWPAIMATALLFTAMHLSRIGDGPHWEVLATITVWNGGFGLFVGYLWARYRNVWALIVVHGAVNSLALIPVLLH
ncbi:hypothetical protein GCM10027290_36870 [Micromonospora sonneratiae]